MPPREFLTLMEGWEGYVPVSRDVAISEAAIAKVNDLLTNRPGWPRHRWQYLLQEALTTDDFPYLLGQILDREILAHYRAAIAPWRQLFRMGRVRDFNTVRRHKLVGADDRLDPVAEKGEYLVAEFAEGRYEYAVTKYGRQFDISWEAIINDDLGAFDGIPGRFATAAVRTEAHLATSTFAMSTGPHTSLFGAPIVDVDGQSVTNLGTLALTIANLETTLELMVEQTDVNGEPIAVRARYLVVPPALELTARSILTSTEKMYVDVQGGAGASIIPYPVANVVPQMGLTLIVDPYLPVVDTSANKNTTWYLFGDPAQGAAMEFGHLRGHETPEVCMKASDKVAVGGGAMPVMAGDFATDNIFYRVRIVIGSAQLDPRFAYAQDGTT